jgi:hypothetical protein
MENTRPLKQLKGTGGLGGSKQVTAEVLGLCHRCEYLERVISPIATHLSTLKDRVDTGGGIRHVGVTPVGAVSRIEHDSAIRALQAKIGGLKQGLIGASSWGIRMGT